MWRGLPDLRTWDQFVYRAGHHSNRGTWAPGRITHAPTPPFLHTAHSACNMPGYRDRESIVPMDFEYDNRVGPVDSQSPFIAHAAKKRKLDSFASSHPQSEEQVQKLNQGPPFGHHAAGTHSIFDTPSKSSFATPNHPKLSDPSGQRFLFSQSTQKALPQTPQNRNVWDLRTPQSTADSSGGETPSHDTPAQDSDSATPDTQLALTMGGLTHGERKSPSKRSSFFKNLPWNKSPSKEKSSREKPYSKKAENRVLKRRIKSRTRHNEYESEAESPAKNIQQAAPAIGFAAKIPGVLAWLEAHPNLPNVLSYYMQFLVNAALGFFFLYIVYGVYCAVMADIDNEANNKVRDIMHEIAVCASEYERNGCDPKPVPAVESMCQNWKRCKERDAYQVARASVGARTFAMIFNSFVEEFSYKSMVFFFLLVLLLILLLILYWKLKSVCAAIADKADQLQHVAAVRTQDDQIHALSLQSSPYSLHGPPNPRALLPSDEHIADEDSLD